MCCVKLKLLPRRKNLKDRANEAQYIVSMEVKNELIAVAAVKDKDAGERDTYVGNAIEGNAGDGDAGARICV